MTSYEELLKTGQWWSPEWWNDAALAASAGSDLEDVQQSIELLKGLFGPEWTRRALPQGRANAIIRFLWNGTGIWPLQDLLRLARVMRKLGSPVGLPRKLEELCGPKSQSSFFEICIASRLSEPGCQVEFVSESNAMKMPDLCVKAQAHTFHLECKHLGNDHWERWVQQLHFDVFPADDAAGKWNRLTVDVELNSRLSELHFTDKSGDDSIATAIRDEIAERIRTKIADADLALLPLELQLTGVARILIRSRETDGVGGSVGGIEVSPVAKLRKILVNGVLPALQQLARSECGVIAISSEHLPDQTLFEVAMDGLSKAKPDDMSRIACVALFSSLQPNLLWVNKAKRESVDIAACLGF